MKVKFLADSQRKGFKEYHIKIFKAALVCYCPRFETSCCYAELWSIFIDSLRECIEKTLSIPFVYLCIYVKWKTFCFFFVIVFLYDTNKEKAWVAWLWLKSTTSLTLTGWLLHNA